MRLIVMGNEYTGKTTLVRTLKQWMAARLGEPAAMIHDHFMPRIGEGRPGVTPEEEEAEFYKLAPFALEMYTRYVTHYHLGDHFYSDNDHIVVNWFYGDAVYAPVYFGFGGPDEYADRHKMARSEEAKISHIAPDTVLIKMTASPEAIRERIRAEPRPTSRYREEDIAMIGERFDHEFGSALIRRRFTLDTTGTTPEQTFAEFLTKLEPHLTVTDRLRLLTHSLVTPEM
jgi:thymidylate kinase